VCVGREGVRKEEAGNKRKPEEIKTDKKSGRVIKTSQELVG